MNLVQLGFREVGLSMVSDARLESVILGNSDCKVGNFIGVSTKHSISMDEKEDVRNSVVVTLVLKVNNL